MLSVIICTHNPKPDYLRRVLDALRAQTLPQDQWELIMIDNASRETLAEGWNISWHPRAQCVREDRLGLAFARARGISEAIGSLLVFVDDDNVLDANYLEEALRLAEAWPQLAVIGGAILPEFEVEPPQYLREHLRMLALRDVQEPRWSNVGACDQATPWGAGMCVRRVTALAYKAHLKSTELKLTDRSGTSLLSGGDDEFSYIACSMGFGRGIFPQLRLTYLISSGRLRPDYLVRLAHGMNISHIMLAYKWQGSALCSPLRFRRLASLVYDLIVFRGLNRRMRFARFRAEIDAYRIIRSSQIYGPALTNKVSKPPS